MRDTCDFTDRGYLFGLNGLLFNGSLRAYSVKGRIDLGIAGEYGRLFLGKQGRGDCREGRE